ncbi:MAG: glycosyltransferase family 2 protein [Rhodobacteraceae bacterium]|nr:glycosyltransferase family 2 protein [Paracoccaceae bacterium]
MMKLCVLMTAYNEERYIASAIDSLLDHPLPCDVIMVIVNDGSTDGTVKIIEGLAEKHRNIRLINTINQGVAKARNLLLQSIPDDCDLVTFLDADDAFAKGHLMRETARMIDDPSLDLTYGQICLVDTVELDLAAAARQDSTIMRGIHFSTGIFRKSLLQKVGFFDELYEQAEDTDYLLRLFETGPNMYHNDEIGVYYRQHAGNMTNDLSVQRRNFMRAMLGHAKRLKADPNLTPLDGKFKVTNLSTELGAQRR